MLSKKPWRPEFVPLFGAATFAALISRFCHGTASFRFGCMALLRRWFLIFSALVLGGGQVFAASTREDRDYTAAVKAFQDGMWSRAETEFGQFRNKYPESTNAASAVLFQAEARYKLGQFTNAITLLATNRDNAGPLADEYLYWIGEGWFQNRDFTNAAETFFSLARDFPESSLRLRGIVEAASACAHLTNWLWHDALLESTNGVFQLAAQQDPGNELVVDGQLSRENSKYQQRDFPGVAAVYQWLTNHWQTLNQEQRCQSTHLFYLATMEMGDFAAALAATTNLARIAGSPTNLDWLAAAWAAQGATLERLSRMDDAIAAYGQNLATNAPVARRREAILKIAKMDIVQGRLTNAEETLTNFLAQFPDVVSADIALLTAGELHLKDYAAQPSATNELPAARDCFDQFLSVFTNSPLTGKARLDHGWCEWFAKDMTNSLDDFEAAVNDMKMSPPSEDLAMARFKMGDVLFALANYAGALENYRAVLDDFTNFPAVAGTLGDRALYQSLRVNLLLTNYDGASNTLSQLLKRYPASDLAPDSELLYGEGLADAGEPAKAREQFQKFETQFPGTPLRPKVEFAIARTYELEINWPAAIAGYQGWLKEFPTNDMQPQAIYALACAEFQAGNTTNAFGLFTNFVARFPASELAPQAQWWVADHFFGLGGTNYVDAERNYKTLFQNTNWQGSPLVDRARMMAGRAAVGRQDYNGAIRDYFSKLEVDTNCPMDLRVHAAFAHGDALMLMDSTDTNKPLANFGQAITNEFSQIVQLNPTNENAALAWVEIGECWLQLANYGAATNAYAQVLSTNVLANISLRSQAQIGIGIALEKMAALAAGEDQKALVELAKDNYADVLFTKNLRDDEAADSSSVKKAGLLAAAAAETLGEWDQAADIYADLKRWLPQLGDSLDKKIAVANAHLSQGKN
jgi:TolA-binding protein